MKERPILMQGWGVRATLDGRKSQTRRLINPQPDYSILKAGTELEPHRCPCLGPAHYGRSEWGLYGAPYHYSDVPCFGYNCPYGQPGDLLYFRETWADLRGTGIDGSPDPLRNPKKLPVAYGAHATTDSEEARKDFGIKWKPSIFMPKWAARIWRRITDTRVERVQDISDEDITAEGCEPEICNSAWDTFCYIWDSINAKPKLSKRNPWTRALEKCYVSYPWEDIQETRLHRSLVWYVIGNPFCWAITSEKADR